MRYFKQETYISAGFEDASLPLDGSWVFQLIFWLCTSYILLTSAGKRKYATTDKFYIDMVTILRVLYGPEVTHDAKWRWKCKISILHTREPLYPDFQISKRLEYFKPPPCQPPRDIFRQFCVYCVTSGLKIWHFRFEKRREGRIRAIWTGQIV